MIVAVRVEWPVTSRIQPARATKAVAVAEILDPAATAGAGVDVARSADALRAIASAENGGVRVFQMPHAVHRVARFAADLVVLLLVVDVSLQFVDAVRHPVVAVLFTLASAAAALRQMTAWRGDGAPRRVASASQYGWALLGVASWFAATYAASHQAFYAHVPPVPAAIQAVGAVCLIAAIVVPLLRVPHLTNGAFALCPHAIGGVLLTGNPVLATLVAMWLAATCHTAWRAARRREPQHVGVSPAALVRTAA